MSEINASKYLKTRENRSIEDKNNGENPGEIRIGHMNGNTYESLNSPNAHTEEYDTLQGMKTKSDKSVEVSSKATVIGLIAMTFVSLVLSITGFTVAVISSNKVASQLDRMNSFDVKMEANVSRFHTEENKSLEQKDFTTNSDKTVVFTATGASGSNPLIFQSIIYNNGNSYNSTSGLFTCTVPGFYYFASTLTKAFLTVPDMLQCFIYINWSLVLGAAHDPYSTDAEYDGYSITVSGTFHLTASDTVHVGCSHGADALHTDIFSSFTGFLVAPDN